MYNNNNNPNGRQTSSSYYEGQQQPVQRLAVNPRTQNPRARSSFSGPTPTYPRETRETLQESGQDEIFADQRSSYANSQPRQQPLGDAQIQLQIKTEKIAPSRFGENNPDFSNDPKQICSDIFVFMPDGSKRQESRNNNGGTGSAFVRCLAAFLVWLLVIFTFPFAFCFYFHVVYEYERAVIFRMGAITTEDRSSQAGSTGIFFTLPCIETYRKVDMRTICINFPDQDSLTLDNVSIKLDGLIYYRIFNAILSVTQIQDPHISTNLLAQAILRNTISSKSFNELITHREALADELCSSLQAITASWGIRIEKVYIREFRLPPELQKALSSEVAATRMNKVNLIAAEGEKSTGRVLKEASDIISASPAALQLRYIQALNSITAGGQTSTVVLPLPVDLLGLTSRNSQPCTHRTIIASGIIPESIAKRIDRAVGDNEAIVIKKKQVLRL